MELTSKEADLIVERLLAYTLNGDETSMIIFVNEIKQTAFKKGQEKVEAIEKEYQHEQFLRFNAEKQLEALAKEINGNGGYKELTSGLQKRIAELEKQLAERTEIVETGYKCLAEKEKQLSELQGRVEKAKEMLLTEYNHAKESVFTNILKALTEEGKK